MKNYILLLITTILLESNSCSAQNFIDISRQLEKKTSKAINTKTVSFHDLRVALLKSGWLNFIDFTKDTLYILESYDIQDGSYISRLWTRKSIIQYKYTKDGFDFNQKKLFTKFTIQLIQNWDTISIRKEEMLYSSSLPVYTIYGARIIFGSIPLIAYIRFKEFFYSKRDEY